MTWRQFELKAKQYLEQVLPESFDQPRHIPIKIHQVSGGHNFDWVSDKTIVECKSNTWTKGNNIPSAKISIWNETMYFFSLVQTTHKKILFAKKELHPITNVSLARHYIDRHSHLIPSGVHIWEFDIVANSHEEIWPKSTTA